MRFIEMAIRNFMRFKRATIQLADCGMTLIDGVNKDDESATSNGAGKSTIVDALVWCLYGVTTHEPSADGDDVVNEHIAENCEVRVMFYMGDEQYVVTRRRAWKKGGKPVQLVFEHGGDGFVDISKGIMRDTQRAIEDTIGMGVMTFRHACVFGQGRAYRFSRLTDTEKKAVLDEMLGSELYAKAGQRASEQLAELEAELRRAENALKNASESRLEAQTRLDRHLERQAKARRLARSERDSVKREVAHISKELAELPILNAEAGHKAFAKARGELETAREALSDAKRTAKDTLRRLDAFEARREKTKAMDDTTCVTCEQRIAPEHTKRMLRELDRLRDASHAEHVKALDAVEVQQVAYDAALAKAKRLEREGIDARENERTRTRLESDLKAAKVRQASLKEREVDFDELIEDEKATLAKLDKAIAKHESTIAELRAKCEGLKFWQEGFGTKGLRSLMLDSTLPYLNAKLEQYTNALTAGNISIEFKTQRELKGGGLRDDFYVDVQNKFGATKYNMNSIGERAKVDIIVGLALQDMAAARSRVPVNVAFFDEVFDGLDDRGIDRAVQTLSQLQRESAFVISHKAELKTFFSRRITVVKENGESRLEAA